MKMGESRKPRTYMKGWFWELEFSRVVGSVLKFIGDVRVAWESANSFRISVESEGISSPPLFAKFVRLEVFWFTKSSPRIPFDLFRSYSF